MPNQVVFDVRNRQYTGAMGKLSICRVSETIESIIEVLDFVADTARDAGVEHVAEAIEAACAIAKDVLLAIERPMRQAARSLRAHVFLPVV